MKIFIADKNNINVININKNELLNLKLKTYNGHETISIQYENNNYILTSNKKYKILETPDITNSFLDKKILNKTDKIYIYNIEQDEKIIIYSFIEIDNVPKYYNYKTDSLVIAGKYFVDSNLKLLNEENPEAEIKLTKNVNNEFTLETKELISQIYINNDAYSNQNIKNGDLVFYDGFYFTLINSMVIIFYSSDKVTANYNTSEIIENEKINYENLIKKNNNLSLEENYFKRTPKIKRKIEVKRFQIDAPSPKELKERMPIMYTMLPMLLMSMTSIVSSANVINSITLKERTLEESMPSLIVSGCMILAMIAYPILSHAYNKRRESKREIKRIEEYKDYIYEQKRKILEEIDFQKQILLDNF